MIERIDDFKTVRTGEGHTELYKVGTVIEIETKPAWIAGIHGRNIANRPGGILQSPGTIKKINNDFQTGINIIFPYIIGGTLYLCRQTVDYTRKIRGRLGLRGYQISRFKRTLINLFGRNKEETKL